MVNPLWTQVRAHGTGHIDALIARYLVPFDAGHDRLDAAQKRRVAEKKSNTAELLAAAKSYTLGDCSQFAQNLYESTGPDDKESDSNGT